MIATVPHHDEGQWRNVGRDTLLSSVFLPFAGAPMTFIPFSLCVSLSRGIAAALKRSQVDELERM